VKWLTSQGIIEPATDQPKKTTSEPVSDSKGDK
jgi:hypothetical protein